MDRRDVRGTLRQAHGPARRAAAHSEDSHCATNSEELLVNASTTEYSTFKPRHFLWEVSARVGTITLNRPERKNPLTFDSYAELRDLFHGLQHAADVKAV